MLKKAGVRLVAVSYDEPKILFEFGKQHKIAFALLSDPDSKVIEAFGIRNLEVKGSRIDGVPHPGTFLIDGKGVIRAKLFYEGYEKRHQAQDIAAAASDLSKVKTAGSNVPDSGAAETGTEVTPTEVSAGDSATAFDE